MKIYSDGSCNFRNRLGGIGVYIILDEGKEHFISKGFRDTTISRMEGIALLEGIRFLDKTLRCRVDIYSDSQYIIKSFTEERLKKWEYNGWYGIKNIDMWKAILYEIRQRPMIDFRFHHIRGHLVDLSNKNVLGNNIADLLANYKTKKKFYSDKLL